MYIKGKKSINLSSQSVLLFGKGSGVLLVRERIERGKKLWRYEKENVTNGALVITSILILGAAQSLLLRLYSHLETSFLWAFIWVNNLIVSLDFFIISWFISFGSSVAMRRCRELRTFDCWLWEKIVDKPFIQGVGIYLILMPFLILHSLSAYAPGVWIGIVFGLIKIYGFFELSGFLLMSLSGAYISRSRALGLFLSVLGELLLLIGAVIESFIA